MQSFSKIDPSPMPTSRIVCRAGLGRNGRGARGKRSLEGADLTFLVGQTLIQDWRKRGGPQLASERLTHGRVECVGRHSRIAVGKLRQQKAAATGDLTLIWSDGSRVEILNSWSHYESFTITNQAPC